MKFSSYLKRHYISLFDFSDEIVVAEFPKCGGSFLSLTLAHMHAFSDDKYYPSIYAFNSFVRDLDQIQPFSYLKKNKSKISKTHKHYLKNFKNVVCLTRDPYDVMSSYYRHLNIRAKIDKNMSLIDFVKSSKYGISSYCRFLESYCKAPLQSTIIFVKYEDLLKNTYKIIRDILLIFKGQDINDLSIEKRNLILNKNSKKAYSEIESTLWNYDVRRNEISLSNGSFINNQKNNISYKRDRLVDEYIKNFILKSPSILNRII